MVTRSGKIMYLDVPKSGGKCTLLNEHWLFESRSLALGTAYHKETKKSAPEPSYDGIEEQG